MVEGAKADRRRPGSSDRALFTRLLMGKGGAGRAPRVQEGKSLASPCPRCLAGTVIPYDQGSGIMQPGSRGGGYTGEQVMGSALGREDASGIVFIETFDI